MKSPVIFFIVFGLLLTGIAFPVCAQDENPATTEVAAAVPGNPADTNAAPEKAPAPIPVAEPEEPAEEQTEEAAAVEKPVAVESAVPAVEKTESTTTIVTTIAAKPIVAESNAPAAGKGPDFELDRSLSNTAAESGAKAEAGPQPKASFWRRLFGREKDAPVADGRPTDTGAETKPAALATNTAAANKLLTPEEIVAAQEEIRRQAKEVEALKALDVAYRAMERNDFEGALKSFNQAMNAMPVRPHTVETRQKAMQSQAECEYRIALNYYKDGKYQEAKDAIRRALGYYSAHPKANRLSAQIKKDEARKIEVESRPVPVRHSAEHLDRAKQIRASIDLGRQYYAIGEYEKARREFKNVLVLDEKNEDAAAWLKKVHEKMYNVETDQMNRQQADMIAQVRDTWTPPVKREIAGPETRVLETTTIDKGGKRALLAKLNGIVIPQLEFRMANIVDVIKYMDTASIACDKDSAPGDKGVNFILQLKRPGAAAETAPAAAVPPAEGEFGGEGGTTVAQGNVPSVTLSLRNITLIDAIKYITEVTGLKYRIEENVVVITPSDYLVGELITRTYKVQPNIAETIMGAAGGAAGVAKMEFGGAAPVAERGDVKKFFVDAGVPFPEGTSIVYKPSLNLLIAKNTADNLENFERILASLNIVPVQVEIEARFVEVAQGDLEELGVEWLLKDNWELAENAGAGTAIPLASRERIQMDQNTISKGLRNFAQGASGITPTPGGNMAGILSFSSVLTNPEVTMVLHALEQKSGANLLSAPKVTTKSGANAEIKVVSELIYPTEFTLVTPAAAGSTQGSQTPMSFVQPGAFQTRDTGVILNVTPTVGPDGFSIDLVMLPQVCELTDWLNYGTKYPNPNGTGTYDLNMPQPIFKSRNITTSITIWDGQTVVMGGLITEKQSTTLDKIPFLGDIPLLGFLFQSKTSNSQKFNLLIFVTANLVDPAGNKINKDLIATATGAANTSAAFPASP
ncbi:MAG: hypothetical protein WC381_10525 [Kiritimatiellia bacterium]|jgi:general secretion pathway protein D